MPRNPSKMSQVTSTSEVSKVPATADHHIQSLYNIEDNNTSVIREEVVKTTNYQDKSMFENSKCSHQNTARSEHSSRDTGAMFSRKSILSESINSTDIPKERFRKRSVSATRLNSHQNESDIQNTSCTNSIKLLSTKLKSISCVDLAQSSSECSNYPSISSNRSQSIANLTQSNLIDCQNLSSTPPKVLLTPLPSTISPTTIVRVLNGSQENKYQYVAVKPLDNNNPWSRIKIQDKVYNVKYYQSAAKNISLAGPSNQTTFIIGKIDNNTIKEWKQKLCNTLKTNSDSLISNSPNTTQIQTKPSNITMLACQLFLRKPTVLNAGHAQPNTTDMSCTETSEKQRENQTSATNTSEKQIENQTSDNSEVTPNGDQSISESSVSSTLTNVNNELKTSPDKERIQRKRKQTFNATCYNQLQDLPTVVKCVRMNNDYKCHKENIINLNNTDNSSREAVPIVITNEENYQSTSDNDLGQSEVVKEREKEKMPYQLTSLVSNQESHQVKEKSNCTESMINNEEINISSQKLIDIQGTSSDPESFLYKPAKKQELTEKKELKSPGETGLKRSVIELTKSNSNEECLKQDSNHAKKDPDRKEREERVTKLANISYNEHSYSLRLQDETEEAKSSEMGGNSISGQPKLQDDPQNPKEQKRSMRRKRAITLTDNDTIKNHESVEQLKNPERRSKKARMAKLINNNSSETQESVKELKSPRRGKRKTTGDDYVTDRLKIQKIEEGISKLTNKTLETEESLEKLKNPRRSGRKEKVIEATSNSFTGELSVSQDSSLQMLKNRRRSRRGKKDNELDKDSSDQQLLELKDSRNENAGNENSEYSINKEEVRISNDSILIAKRDRKMGRFHNFNEKSIDKEENVINYANSICKEITDNVERDLDSNDNDHQKNERRKTEELLNEERLINKPQGRKRKLANQDVSSVTNVNKIFESNNCNLDIINRNVADDNKKIQTTGPKPKKKKRSVLCIDYPVRRRFKKRKSHGDLKKDHKEDSVASIENCPNKPESEITVEVISNATNNCETETQMQENEESGHTYGQDFPNNQDAQNKLFVMTLNKLNLNYIRRFDSIVKYNNKKLRVVSKFKKKITTVINNNKENEINSQENIGSPIWEWETYLKDCATAKTLEGNNNFLCEPTPRPNFITNKKCHLKDVNKSIIKKLQDHRKRVEEIHRFGYIYRTHGSLSYSCNKYDCLKDSVCMCEKIPISDVTQEELSALKNISTLYTDRDFHKRFSENHMKPFIYDENISSKDLEEIGIIKGLSISLTRNNFNNLVSLCWEHWGYDCFCQNKLNRVYDAYMEFEKIKYDLEHDAKTEDTFEQIDKCEETRALRWDAFRLLCWTFEEFRVWNRNNGTLLITVENKKPVSDCFDVTCYFKSEDYQYIKDVNWLSNTKHLADMWLMIRKKSFYLEIDRVVEKIYRAEGNEGVAYVYAPVEDQPIDEKLNIEGVNVLDQELTLNIDSDSCDSNKIISCSDGENIRDTCYDTTANNSLNVFANMGSTATGQNTVTNDAQYTVDNVLNNQNSITNLPADLSDENGIECCDNLDVLNPNSNIPDKPDDDSSDCIVIEDTNEFEDNFYDIECKQECDSDVSIEILSHTIEDEGRKNIKPYKLNKGSFEVRYLQIDINEHQQRSTDGNRTIAAKLPVITDIARWRVLKIAKQCQWDFLKLCQCNAMIARQHILNAVSKAKKDRTTYFIKEEEFKNYVHPRFGIYCVPNNSTEIFVGPYFNIHNDDLEVYKESYGGIPILSTVNAKWFIEIKDTDDGVIDLTTSD